jgi:hypothetical protein
MTFFNKKEEVLEVQLTRLGRQLLSQGRFKPAYYEFMDDDVVYDRQYVMSGSIEEQNEIKTRIKDKLTLREPTARKKIKNFQELIPVAFGNIIINLDKPTNKQIEGLGTFTPYSNYRMELYLQVRQICLLPHLRLVVVLLDLLMKKFHN